MHEWLLWLTPVSISHKFSLDQLFTLYYKAVLWQHIARYLICTINRVKSLSRGEKKLWPQTASHLQVYITIFTPAQMVKSLRWMKWYTDWRYRYKWRITTDDYDLHVTDVYLYYTCAVTYSWLLFYKYCWHNKKNKKQKHNFVAFI